MPIQAHVVDNSRLLCVRFSGEPNGDEILGMAKHLTALPGYWPGIPELVDSSRVLSTDLDYASMRAVVRAAIDKDKGLTTTKRISFFAPDDTNFGMARMFCTITDMAPEPVEAGAFRTEAEALGFVGRIETRLTEIPGYVAAFGG